ncbi:MAG: hypothetical protein ACREXP_16965, partial [Steroidobacteraceae bacterium]
MKQTKKAVTVPAYLADRPARAAKAAQRTVERRTVQALTASAIDDLEALITEQMRPRKGKPSAWVAFATHSMDPPRFIAVAVLAAILSPWVKGKAPSGATIYKRIASALSAERAVGATLLALALRHGFAERRATPEDKARGIRADRVKRVYTSWRTDAALIGITRLLVRERPGVAASTFTSFRVHANGRGLEAPEPYGPGVQAALDVLASTRWSINPYMLRVLQESPDVQRAVDGALIKLDKTRHDYLAALAYAQEWQAQFPDGFYFPLFLDFRGRIYQDAGALQYTSGNDFARSLLQ